MTTATLPWWRSRVIVGTLISAVFKTVFAILVLFDLDVPFAEDELQPLADALALLISLVGDFIAARGRVKQTVAPPITLRKQPPVCEEDRQPVPGVYGETR